MAIVDDIKINIQVETKRRNWLQRLFSKKNPYEYEYIRPKRTLWDFFWHFVRLQQDSNSMHGYIRENGNLCEDWQKRPSKKIMKRYNLNPENTLIHWWLLEEYCEGNLVLKEQKEKENV